MNRINRLTLFIILMVTVAAFACSTVVIAADSKSSTKATASKSKKKSALDTETVKEVQNALVDAGYKIKVDGKMGRQVRTALKKYQKKNRLKVTGRIDKATLGKMGLVSSPDA